jgi:hypothetical protein
MAKSISSATLTAARTLASVVAAVILVIGFWLYRGLAPMALDELAATRGGKPIHCEQYVKTVGVVSGVRAPGFDTGDRRFRAYWLAGKTLGGADAAIEVKFDPQHVPAPRVGQALEIGGTARCDEVGNPFSVSMIEVTRLLR